MNAKETRRLLTVALMAASFLVAKYGFAAPMGEKPRANVTLVATLNNGPAMQPVSWKVYRLDANNNVAGIVDSFNRHSASIPLQPGRYLADVNLNSVNRTRVFDVSSRTSSSVVVAMD